MPVNLLFGQPFKRAKKSKNNCFLAENGYYGMLIEKRLGSVYYNEESGAVKH